MAKDNESADFEDSVNEEVKKRPRRARKKEKNKKIREIV